jgi:hypothetical protein
MSGRLRAPMKFPRARKGSGDLNHDDDASSTSIARTGRIAPADALPVSQPRPAPLRFCLVPSYHRNPTVRHIARRAPRNEWAWAHGMGFFPDPAGRWIGTDTRPRAARTHGQRGGPDRRPSPGATPVQCTTRVTSPQRWRIGVRRAADQAPLNHQYQAGRRAVRQQAARARQQLPSPCRRSRARPSTPHTQLSSR